MGVFDFLRREGGQQSRQTDQGGDDSKTITMACKAGTLYYLRARNVKSGFDDVLCFDNEIMRRRYIGTARESTPTPGDWYFTEYETSAEERLQSELEKQRAALEKSYKQDIAKLEYKIRGLQSDCRNLQNSLSGGNYLQRYNNSQHALDIVKRDLQEERQKNAELLAMIEAVKERKEQEQETKPPVQTQSAAAILQELQAGIYKVLSTRGSLDSYLTEYEQELASITSKIPLQGRIVIAMIQRQVNSI